MMDQSREGRELWRYMQMSSHDFLCQLFEHDKVRMHFARVAGENLVSPDEKATGLGTFVFVGFLEAYGFGVPVGGSGSLTDSLIASISANGGEVLAGRRRRVDSREERPRGRRGRDRTAASSRRRTRVIARAASARLGLDGRRASRPRSCKAANATQISEVGCITVHAALKQPAQVPRGRSHVKAVMIELLPNKYDTIRKSFDSMRYGEFSSYPLVGLGSLTMFDPSRAPAGAATMHAWDYVPYQRADGRGVGRHEAPLREADAQPHGEVHRQPRGQRARLSQRQPGRHGAHVVELPARRPARHRVRHVPVRRASADARSRRNVVPGCERLYLVGPFQHPGGGVFGAGRAAALRAFDDLKIDFEKVGARA